MKPYLHHSRSPYAGGLVRLLAVIVDTIIMLPINSIGAEIFQDNVFLMLSVNLMLTGFYYVMFLSSKWQATPGKRLLRIYVAQQNGAPLSQKQALERYLAYIMPSLPLYSSFSPTSSSILVLWLMIAWFLPILLSEQKTGLHDLLCKTRVLEGRR